MRSKCQVKPIKVIYIEIHRKDDYCLREPMQFNCKVGEVLAAPGVSYRVLFFTVLPKKRLSIKKRLSTRTVPLTVPPRKF